jgi:hypothetical protein
MGGPNCQKQVVYCGRVARSFKRGAFTSRGSAVN